MRSVDRGGEVTSTGCDSRGGRRLARLAGRVRAVEDWRLNLLRDNEPPCPFAEPLLLLAACCSHYVPNHTVLAGIQSV